MPSDFAVNTWALLLNCNCASMCELCCTTCCNQTEVADVVSTAPWGSKASSWVSLAEAESLPDPDDVRHEMLWALCIVLLVLEMSDFDRLGHYRSGLLIVFSRCVIIFFHCRFNACLNHFHLRQSENLASSSCIILYQTFQSFHGWSTGCSRFKDVFETNRLVLIRQGSCPCNCTTDDFELVAWILVGLRNMLQYCY